MKINNILDLRKSKLLLLCASLFIAQNLNAKTTTCHKNEWTKPSSIESTALDGGECNSEFSLNQMQKKGWFIEDIKIKSATKGLSYTYILTNIDPINIEKWQKNKNIKIEKINLNQTTVRISDVNDKTATINIGNLKIGQSGIINHTYENGSKLIVASAFVIQSNENSSKIKFLPFLDLKQNALPTSSRKPTNSDEFVLNYLYDFSLLIAPNNESFKLIRNKFKDSTFLHSDIFASFLKYIARPEPTKEIIQDFALSQNMGTIFIVIDSNVYILDSRTFAVLDKKSIATYNDDSQMPFYTRVEKIETDIFTKDYSQWLKIAEKYISFNEKTDDELIYEDLETDFEVELDKDKDKKSGVDYTNYYKKLLGV